MQSGLVLTSSGADCGGSCCERQLLLLLLLLLLLKLQKFLKSCCRRRWRKIRGWTLLLVLLQEKLMVPLPLQ